MLTLKHDSHSIVSITSIMKPLQHPNSGEFRVTICPRCLSVEVGDTVIKSTNHCTTLNKEYL